MAVHTLALICMDAASQLVVATHIYKKHSLLHKLMAWWRIKTAKIKKCDNILQQLSKMSCAEKVFLSQIFQFGQPFFH